MRKLSLRSSICSEMFHMCVKVAGLKHWKLVRSYQSYLRKHDNTIIINFIIF